MIKGKVLIAGTMNIDGEELTGLFVELDKSVIKCCPFNLLRAEITIEEDKDTKRIREDTPDIGESWLITADSRLKAGEPEEQVMRDYGYVRGTPPIKSCNHLLRLHMDGHLSCDKCSTVLDGVMSGSSGTIDQIGRIFQ